MKFDLPEFNAKIVTVCRRGILKIGLTFWSNLLSTAKKLQSADSPRREKQCLQVWRQKMERLIFGEFVKSAENPCRKRFDINPETSSRHISGTVTDIATILQSGVPRATVYFPADFYFESFNGLFLANFLRLFATFFERE
jgi:hypothetical protein